MSGWKTKAAAALALVYGLLGLILGLHNLDQAMDYVITGLSLLGLGHKIEKAGAAYEQAKTDALADVIKRNSK